MNYSRSTLKLTGLVQANDCFTWRAEIGIKTRKKNKTWPHDNRKTERSQWDTGKKRVEEEEERNVKSTKQAGR